MEGDLEIPEMYGVIPRAAVAIFEKLNQPGVYSDPTVSASYLEIYNEELSDLLVDTESKQHAGDKRAHHGPTKLAIMEGKSGTFCRGLSQRTVESAEDVIALMHEAQMQRRVGETKMNKASSRSHCIFTLTIKAKAILADGSGTLEFTGKVCLPQQQSWCEW
jgi:hypothetical protein